MAEKDDVQTLERGNIFFFYRRRFHLRFRLLALDEAVNLPPGADAGEFMREAQGHIVDEAELDVVYERAAA